MPSKPALYRFWKVDPGSFGFLLRRREMKRVPEFVNSGTLLVQCSTAQEAG